MSRRVLFANGELDVAETQRSVSLEGLGGSDGVGSAPHLIFTPQRGTYGRLSRAEVVELHAELGRWLER